VNFDDYKIWRDNAVSAHDIPSENRFDCLNPFKAMDFTRGWKEKSSVLGSSLDTAFDLWKALHFGERSKDLLHFEPTCGVRSALGRLFQRMQERRMELWLPEDVYPFYKQEVSARSPKLDVRYFRTIPEVDWSELESARSDAALLITDPLSPTGRFLTNAERKALAAWTQSAENRWVIFDSVYLYSAQLPEHFISGSSHHRFIRLLSMSKSWLLRGVFGCAIGPDAEGDWWKALDLAPTAETIVSVLSALSEDPSMPNRQREIFEREWVRREHKLAKYGGNACDAGAGYFRRVHVNFEKAFNEDGILLVPASVFGSNDNDWSIATCLYEASKASPDMSAEYPSYHDR
jgi:aspartate/methionine/tyrosine aminotransferase